MKTSNRVGIRTCSDYSPFGVELDGRTVSLEGYRFGFNTQEKTDEIAGKGNHTTAMYWEYDSRLGRRWNVDPVVKSHESSYTTFANNPILFVDPSGSDTTFFQADGSYDKEAKKGFEQAKKDLDQMVQKQAEKIEKIKSKGIRKEWSEGKLESKLKLDIVRLNNLNKLKEDFDFILDANTPLITYSSDGSKTNGELGLAEVQYNMNTGEVISATVYLKTVSSSVIIHENRHTRQNQLRTKLEQEVEAFEYARIFDPLHVASYINAAKAALYPMGNAPESFGITEMVRWLYEIQ